MATDVFIVPRSGSIRFRTDGEIDSIISASSGDLIISGSGDVGIGTNPSYPLHIYSSGSTIFNVEGSQGTLFSVQDSFVGTLFEVNDQSGLPILEVQATDTVIAGTYNKYTLFVTGSYVGIGNSSPGTVKLNISGSGADDLLQIGDEYMFVSGNGNVGIGTTNPSMFVHVEKSQDGNTQLMVNNPNAGTTVSSQLITSNAGSIDSSCRIITLGTGYTTAGAYVQDGGILATEENLSGGLSILARHASGVIRFYTAGHTNERMRIDANGNVGIGTDNPIDKLEVRDGYIVVDNTQGYRIRNASGTTLWVATGLATDELQMGSGTWNKISWAVAGAAYRMILDRAGRLGIGTATPVSQLHVYSTGSTALRIESQDTTDTNAIYFESNNSVFHSIQSIAQNGELQIRAGDTGNGHEVNIYSDNTEIARFRKSQIWLSGSVVSASSLEVEGKVGINTTRGTYHLSVNGDILVNEYLRAWDGPTNTYHRMTSTQHHFYSAGSNLMQINNGDSVILGDSTSGDVDTRVYTTQGETLRIDGATGFISSSMLYASHSYGVGIGTVPSYPLHVYSSGSTVLNIEGSQGSLFQVRDSFVGTLFEVNDISGIPILSVEAEDTVTMGTFGDYTLRVTGSYVGIGTSDPNLQLANSHSLHVWNMVSASVFSASNGATFGGNVGINTVPNRALSVAGIIQIGANTTYGLGLWSNPPTVYGIHMQTGATYMHGEVSSYYIANIMSSGTDRGFIWSYGTVPCMSLNASTGNLITNGFLSGSAIYGDISQSVPNAPTSVTLTDNTDTFSVSFSASATLGINEYEVWRAEGGAHNAYSLVGLVKEDSITDPMTIIDNSFTISGSLDYRVYALKAGKRSTAATAAASSSGQVADVTNLEVVNMTEHYYIQYDVPNDRRFASVTIKKDAELVEGDLDEAAATEIYSGRANSYMYAIPEADLEKYHQFWVYVVTNT